VKNKLFEEKAFTLLELIVVITLLSVLFALIGFTFIKNIEGSIYTSEEIYNTVKEVSVYNQLEKQIFSKKTANRNISILLSENRLSFYTGYPIFYTGFVRAEYIIQEENNKKVLIYEEFPYIDGKLGTEGLKKVNLGKFDNLSIEVIKDKKVYKSYKGKNFPDLIRLEIDNNIYYIKSR